MLIPAAGFCIFTEFVSCPVFGASVIGMELNASVLRSLADELFTEACVTPSALYRENVALKLSTTLDILTDVMRKCASVAEERITLTLKSHFHPSTAPVARTNQTPKEAGPWFLALS